MVLNMISSLLGTKKGMAVSYDARGRRVGVTMIEVTPNLVTMVKKSGEKDGYNSVQLGTGSRRTINKPLEGLLKKRGFTERVQYLRDVRVDEADVKEGSAISLNQVFSKGDSVKVTGVSKGKGFQGGVRRYGFAGGPKTHGQSDRHRAPGSIGQTTTPGRVYKGKRMAGHMGMETVSVRNLEVIGVDRKNNILTVKGGIPGYRGSLLMVTLLGKIKGYTPPPEEKEEEEEPEKINTENTNGEQKGE